MDQSCSSSIRQLPTALFSIHRTSPAYCPFLETKEVKNKRYISKVPFQGYHKLGREDLRQYTYYASILPQQTYTVKAFPLLLIFYLSFILLCFNLFISHLYCSSIFIIPEEFCNNYILILTVLFWFQNNVVIIRTIIKKFLSPFIFLFVYLVPTWWWLIWTAEICCCVY